MSWGHPWGSEEKATGIPAVWTACLSSYVHAALLESVGTGGPKINQVNARYLLRRRQLNTTLKARGVGPPFPYDRPYQAQRWQAASAARRSSFSRSRTRRARWRSRAASPRADEAGDSRHALDSAD